MQLANSSSTTPPRPDRHDHLRRRATSLLGLTSLLLLLPTAALAEEGADGPVDFAHDVAPIFQAHCVECHGGDEAKGGFSLNTREMFLDGGMAVPGEASDSYFLELVSSSDEDLQMPPSEKPRVPAEQVAILRRWVEQEMPWTAGFSFAEDAYEPPLRPRRPDLPPVRGGRTHPVDRFVDAYFAATSDDDTGTRQAWPLDPIDDATFMRRVYLDLIGLLPTREEVAAFVDDPAPQKRAELVRRLLSDDIRYTEHWLTFWNDLLRNDYSGTGFITGGRSQISSWLYQSLIENKPFDAMARELIAPPTDASRGFIDGIKWRGEVSAGQTLEIQFAQSVSQSLLGINMKCASCHDSFIDRWTLKDAYGLAAIYAEQPLSIYRCDKPTGETAEAAWLFPELGTLDPGAPRNERLGQLAQLMTSDENGRFARTIVNRLWHQLMGHGIVHPVDAMQTEPWSEDLLDYLAVHLVDNDYDLKKTLELIATSEAYQSQTEAIESRQDDTGYRFAGPRAKRMTAEQFVDAVWQLTGTSPVTFDAPVLRGVADPELVSKLTISAKWIWAADDASPPPEQVAFQKVFSLDQAVESAGAIITCDNAYTLYVNGKEVQKDDDWTDLEPFSLTPHLKAGENVLTVWATNGGEQPNPAGLFFQANIDLGGGEIRTIVSDASWLTSGTLPKDASPDKKWIMKWEPGSDQTNSAAVVARDPWSETVMPKATRQLAIAISGARLPVRASLMQSDPLTRSLGRPTRDQIVTSRPNELTTLEAIHLSNNQELTNWFAAGAERWLARQWTDTDALIDALFLAAFTRRPTEPERKLLRHRLGAEPTVHELQDVLWALCVTPEFMLIR